MTPEQGVRGSLRDRIRERQPSDLPVSSYVSGWVQALIQLAVFAGTLWLLQSETRPVPVILLSMAFGWAWFALLMVGHDAMHRAFAPSRWVNEVVAFLTLDCLLFSRASWLYGHHVIHHARPFSKEDRMYLQSDSVAGDLWNLLVMVLSYIASDVTRLFQRPTWHEWLGMSVRVILLWSLMPLAFLPAILFLLLFGNYLGLLSHALPVGRRTTDPVLRQLRTTWDLYPGSFIASLVTGGLNAHATHHVYPSLPRGAQPLGTRILREEAGVEYRCVDTLGGLWTLFRLRRYRTFESATIEAIAAGRVAGGLALLPTLESPHPASDPSPRHRVQPDTPSRATAERRVADRRIRQTQLSFPDRRKVDRRSSIVPETAAQG
jgi:fatty acid desaturase